MHTILASHQYGDGSCFTLAAAAAAITLYLVLRACCVVSAVVAEARETAKLPIRLCATNCNAPLPPRPVCRLVGWPVQLGSSLVGRMEELADWWPSE